MEASSLPLQPRFKLFKDQAVYVGTFIGGPLVAGYLAAENYKQLGQPDKIKTTWTIAIGATILIFAAIFLIPGIEKLPRIVIPITYTFIAQMLVKQYQGKAIITHIENGGETYTIWRAVWIGLIGLLIMFAIIFLTVLIFNKELLK